MPRLLTFAYGRTIELTVVAGLLARVVTGLPTEPPIRSPAPTINRATTMKDASLCPLGNTRKTGKEILVGFNASMAPTSRSEF